MFERLSKLVITLSMTFLLTACITVPESDFLYSIKDKVAQAKDRVVAVKENIKNRIQKKETNKNSYNLKPTITRKKNISKNENKRAVYCSINGGQANFSNSWLPIKQSSFQIIEGSEQNIQIYAKNKASTNMSIHVRFGEGEQKMVFCPDITDKSNSQRILCYSMYALDDDYDLGVKRNFDIPKAVRGSSIKCHH